ncbi:hypothetical protein HD806DRAFT_527312 [Xylariaceae sp. AK1471]|nr:hypothetical protein HD806DRAFT_527312 [Xylariaceae sp. AK1471]
MAMAYLVVILANWLTNRCYPLSAHESSTSPAAFAEIADAIWGTIFETEYMPSEQLEHLLQIDPRRCPMRQTIWTEPFIGNTVPYYGGNVLRLVDHAAFHPQILSRHLQGRPLDACSGRYRFAYGIPDGLRATVSGRHRPFLPKDTTLLRLQ